MKWIKLSVIVLLSALAGVWFALGSQQVAVGGGEEFTIDPSGNLYLLSGEGVLTKASPEGVRLWSVDLPAENEDGDALRYVGLISDSSGSLYLVAQTYERRVDAAGAVQEVVLSEEVQTWSGDGVQQDSVLQVDKTALSQYSTTAYIRKLQMAGETLLALCCENGQFDVIAAQPYSDQAPAVLASYDLGEGEAEIEDCAALSDGTLICSTKGGALLVFTLDGESRDLSRLLGGEGLAGRLSADASGQICCLDRSNGVLYALDPAGSTVERLYSPDTVVDEGRGITFGQLRGVRAVGYGSFCAVSLQEEDLFWISFGAQSGTVPAVTRGWDGAEIARTAGVVLGTAALLALAGWLLGRIFRRWRLTGKILLRFLPALLLVTAALAGGALGLLQAQQRAAREDALTAAAKTAAAQLDGLELSLTALRGFDEAQRSALQERLDRAGGYAAEISGRGDVGLILYTAEGERLYGVCTTLERDAFSETSSLSPVSLEFPAETAAAIAACAAEGGQVSFTRDGTDYAGAFQPVLDSAGGVAALVEARAVEEDTLRGQSPLFYAGAAAGAGIVILLVWLLAVLGGAFRPLKELSRCIGEISAGRWNVQARITSGDELADIGMSFNQMTEKLNQYISNMVLLNNEYIKFTPRELFQLMGKTKVTDLQLRDKSVRDMSLLYVNFSLGGEKLDSEAYFALMNESFDKLFDVVDINHGIIEHFDGSGMVALFPYQVRDALNTAISLKETMARENSAVELKMLISADETLVGVAGNQKRQTITAISGTIMDIYALTSLMDELGTRSIITRPAVERIGGGFYFNCREIGAGDTGRETLYEFLDGMDPYEKKLHLVTKASFEQGVHDYQAGRYAEARKRFADVLQTNERDSVAMYYLMLCDSHLHTEAVLSR